MDPVTEKHADAIDNAVQRLISRASDTRGVTAEELRPRVVRALEKYIAKGNPGPERAEILQFIDEIRADDLCLVLACERGDEKAWEDLVANFDPTVKAAARKMASGSEDAEDLASSIWAELYGLRQDSEGKRKAKLGYYSGLGSLAGWLRAVVSQLAVDEFRKQSKFVQIEEDRDFENLAETASADLNNREVVHHSDDPEELLTAKQTAGDVSAALTQAIAGLEAEDRLLLRLYYFEGLKLKDLASAFGYHEATASRKMARIQTEIRKTVEKQLRREHGWTESEVANYLAETAAKLGISFEKMLAVFVAAAAVQDLYM